MKKFLYLPFFLFSLSLIAQKHDNIWYFGGGGGTLTDSFGVTIVNFDSLDQPLVTDNQVMPIRFASGNTSFCDSSGQILFYSNNKDLYNAQHQIMDGGANITLNSSPNGNHMPQGIIAVPFPEHPDQYIIISLEDHASIPIGWKLFYHLIDMQENGGLGKVVLKRQLLIQDTISYGKLSVVKHGNGRDWWFVVPKEGYSANHYVGLVNPWGVSITYVLPGELIKEGLGQSTFTPDGSKYIKVDDDNLNTSNQITIFDFDRCTGQLSNYRTHFPNHANNFGNGCAVSPDSRWLYVASTRNLYQYDLYAPDIFASETLIDTWDSTYYYNFWPSDFYLSQLGPDGRIYINSTNGSVSLHRINFPNRPGTDCNFIQNDIWTPTQIKWDMPNLPNYRLGPLDGSPCDTLGIDNHPLANYRWEQEDTSQVLHITFTDLSAYAPETWYWDFGDGAVSTDTNPFHTYAAPGLYTVCLVVSNANSSDTLCRLVNVGVSSVNTAHTEPYRVKAWPNPFSTDLYFGLSGLDYLQGTLMLYDAQGRVVRRAAWAGPGLRLDTGELEKGVYFYTVEGKDGTVLRGKVLKI